MTRCMPLEIMGFLLRAAIYLTRLVSITSQACSPGFESMSDLGEEVKSGMGKRVATRRT